MRTWERWRNTGRQALEGGQGRIFFVTDTRRQIQGTYALKELKNPRRKDRFQREIDAIVRLGEHPNVIKVVDQGAVVDASKPFYVMELADRSLAGEIAAGGPKESKDLFAIYKAICAGVSHLHAHGIIHRDLKPENILFVGRTPKVADLGLCLVAELERLTATIEGVGPRFYMAPELEDGKTLTVTTAADIYSLGKILYFMLSSGRIFSREKQKEPDYDLAAIRCDPRYRLFEQVWHQTLTPRPRDRFKTIERLLHAFDTACRSFMTHPRTRLIHMLGPLSEAHTAPSARDVGRLSSLEADELSSMLLQRALAVDTATMRALAARISAKGVAPFIQLLGAQNGIEDRYLALIGEAVYEDKARAKRMMFARQSEFDARLDRAVLQFSRNRVARENLVNAKLGRASSNEQLMLIALRKFARWSDEARTQLLQRCAYGVLGKESERHVLAVSRRKDLTPTQYMFIVAALAHRGSRDAVARLIEMGQALPDKKPDLESPLRRRIQAFAGGLLLMRNVKVLKRLGRVRWKSQVLAYGIRIGVEAATSPDSAKETPGQAEDSG